MSSAYINLRRHGLATLGPWLVGSLASLTLAGGAAQAQVSPAQVTPRDIAPPASDQKPAALPVGAPGVAVPPGAEKLKVQIADIVVEDQLPGFDSVISGMVAPLKGQVVTGTAIYQLAALIEQIYSAAGYPLVRVIVPPQELADGGTLHLRVIDGFIEAIDGANLPEHIRAPVLARLKPLIGRHGLRTAELERRITLASGVPGATIRPTLAAGDTPGGVKLVVEGEWHPFSGQFGADNRMSRGFRHWQANFQLSGGSLIGIGDQFYLFLSGEPNPLRAFRNDAPRRVAGAGVILPLGHDGLAFTAEATVSDTQAIVDPTVLPTRGRFERYVGKLSYPLVKTRAKTVNITGSFEYSKQYTDVPLFAFRLNEDALNVARLAFDWGQVLPWDASFSISSQVSKGINIAGVRTQADVDATGIGFSRYNADTGFFKLEAELHYSQQLGGGLSGMFGMRAQIAGNPLPSSEVFALDGVDGISSMTSGTVGSDGGWNMRGELAKAIEPRLGTFRLPTSLYAFAAAGQVTYKFDLPGQIEKAHAWGAGVRLRPVLWSAGLKPEFALEYARGTAGGPGMIASRVNFSTVLRF